MPREKQWLPPSPILGSVDMIGPILGPVMPIPPFDELLQAEDGQVFYTEDGEPIELES